MNPAVPEPAYRHNGQHVARAAFYAIACDPRRSVAVEACAGAGKTWMLVSRIVRALLEGCPPHEILAITFTRKAAGEMRARLHEWLAQFARQPLEELDTELRLRGVDLSQISPQRLQSLRLQLQNLQQTLLRSGRPVQIRTFHGWFAALLRTAPLAVLEQLGLPVSYELLEDDAEAVDHVWRRFWRTLLAQPEARVDYEALVASHGRSQTQKALAAALARRTEFTLADAQGVVDASVEPFALRHPGLAAFAEPWQALQDDAARARWHARAAALGAQDAKTPQKAAAAVVDALLRPPGTEQLVALRNAFFVKDDDRLNKNLAKFAAAQEAEAELQALCAAQRQFDAWAYHQRLARLARLLLAEFAALKRERGWIDMNDVERAALTLLSDSLLSGWVQERLDARVRHLLIDEFQDTNPLQWQALHAWLSGYAGAGQAPAVFIVGDPKQSIYRFRRAEPQVFRAAQAFIAEGLGGDRLSCDHTRRNAPEVIATVNAAMQAAQDAGQYSDYRTHTTESRDIGAVLCLPQIARDALPQPAANPAGWRDSLTTPRLAPEETLRALECRQAAQWLAQQLQHGGLRPQDVMVLSRRRAHLAVMQDELRRFAIATEQPEKTALADAPEVQDVLALLDALVSPGHDLSLARALRSPLFGLADTDLAQIALARKQAGEGASCWREVLSNKELLPASLSGLEPVLTQYTEWLGSLPPHDALAAIYHAGDVLARYAAATPPARREAALAHLRALLGAALQIDGGRYATPYALVRALKSGGVKAPMAATAPGEGGAVRLLTVHGAKGLEAPLVLLLDTDAAPPRAETMGVLVDWPGESAAPRRFVFLASETQPPECCAELLETEQTERRREELNALYVAMTRARLTLAISSVQPHRAADASWWQRLQPLCTPVDASAAPSQPHALAAQAAYALPVLPTLPAAARLATLARMEEEPQTPAARLGEAMHRLLEWAPMAGVNRGAVENTDAVALRQQAAVGREFGLDAEQVAQAAQMATRILQGQGVWAWQADLLDWHGNEVELLHGGILLRLDRLVRRRDTGAWWVLDYKSAADPERQPALRQQLALYRRAVALLHTGVPVHAAFLTAQGQVMALEESDYDL
ncbi:MAG TPA: UvrD-helicase domain-containing protein [Burkholderiaceae bacterium]